MIFSRRKGAQSASGLPEGDFGFLDPKVLYLDSACQTLRPQCVIDAEREYYCHFNACGGRVQYGWGKKVDARVTSARKRVLRMLGKSEQEYAVAFTLNTSYGINLVLHQLPQLWSRIVTSEIEHNSVFLPTMTWAEKRGAERRVLPREDDGGLRYQPSDLERAVVLVNTASNIDGRVLTNVSDLARDTHSGGGILLLDAAQTMGHDARFLASVPFDALFASGHKMYGPSIGIIVMRRELLRSLDHFFLGGGTVADVTKDDLVLLADDREHERLEVGLQHWAGIIGLDRALEWLETVRPEGEDRYTHEQALSMRLFDGVCAIDGVRLVNTAPSPVLSFAIDSLDSHRLALYLDAQGILCRSGHFCCHYYLQHRRGLPAQLRASIGLQTTHADIDRFNATLQTIATSVRR